MDVSGTARGPADAGQDGASFPADIVVLTEGLSELEMAAVTAVLGEVIAEATSNTVEKIPDPSAWQRSQRIMRPPIVPDPGAWRSFSG